VVEKNFVPVRMIEVVAAEVGAPTDDGTPEGRLYKIPIRIEPPPPDDDWRMLFLKALELPSAATGRPVCNAQVYVHRIVLSGTTLEELESTHLTTLKDALAQANEQYAELLAARRVTDERKRQDAATHVRSVEAAAKRIKFD
jgi:hypothetical protein